MKSFAQRPLLAPGAVVGELTIVGLALDHGGERLHRATTEDGEAVVVEVIDWPDETRAREATERARPLIEAAPAGSLRLLVVGDDGPRSWRILSPFDGGPIGPDARSMPRTDRLAIAHAVTAALVALHGAGRVHGDLRAACVVQDRASASRALVFGAERLPAARVGLGPERIGPSPEQARGEAPTAASDLHALGMLLYRLLADRAPFAIEPTDGLDLRTALVVTTPPSLPADAPVAELRLTRLVGRLMSKAPTDRPTALEALRAIEGVETGAPPASGRRARMVARATQPMPAVDGDRPVVAVLGVLPPAIHAQVVDAGFGLRSAERATDAVVLVALGQPRQAIDALVARWPAVVADVDPDDIGDITALARAGLAGVLARPLDGGQVVRCIARAVRVVERNR